MKELIIPIREVITRTGGVDNKKVFNDHYAVFERIRDKDAEGARKAMMKSIAYARQILEKKNEGLKRPCPGKNMGGEYFFKYLMV
jgi:DNA-binding FadR family transcriptional regulator